MPEMHEEDGRIVGLLPNDDGHGFEKVAVVALYIASGMQQYMPCNTYALEFQTVFAGIMNELINTYIIQPDLEDVGNIQNVREMWILLYVCDPGVGDSCRGWIVCRTFSSFFSSPHIFQTSSWSSRKREKSATRRLLLLLTICDALSPSTQYVEVLSHTLPFYCHSYILT